MKSRVKITFQSGLKVERPIEYISLGVFPAMEGNLWKGILVEIEHEENTSPFDIIEKARATVRELLALIGVGRGLNEPLGEIKIHFLSPSSSNKNIGIIGNKLDAQIVRPLLTMPDEALVDRLFDDPKLLRQCEALTEARSNSDLVPKIRWAYMVLEQEMNRGQGYSVRSDYRYIRNGVSHPELNNRENKTYFQNEIGADFPDLSDPVHIKFLDEKSKEILNEAIQIVERQLSDYRFWQ